MRMPVSNSRQSPDAASASSRARGPTHVKPSGPPESANAGANSDTPLFTADHGNWFALHGSRILRDGGRNDAQKEWLNRTRECPIRTSELQPRRSNAPGAARARGRPTQRSAATASSVRSQGNEVQNGGCPSHVAHLRSLKRLLPGAAWTGPFDAWRPTRASRKRRPSSS